MSEQNKHNYAQQLSGNAVEDWITEQCKWMCVGVLELVLHKRSRTELCVGFCRTLHADIHYLPSVSLQTGYRLKNVLLKSQKIWYYKLWYNRARMLNISYIYHINTSISVVTKTQHWQTAKQALTKQIILSDRAGTCQSTALGNTPL